LGGNKNEDVDENEDAGSQRRRELQEIHHPANQHFLEANSIEQEYFLEHFFFYISSFQIIFFFSFFNMGK
jgi:hypothetical protein